MFERVFWSGSMIPAMYVHKDVTPNGNIGPYFLVKDLSLYLSGLYQEEYYHRTDQDYLDAVERVSEDLQIPIVKDY